MEKIALGFERSPKAHAKSGLHLRCDIEKRKGK